MIDCKRLAALRKKAKMKQYEVANAIGIERTTYCRYESNQISPPIEMVIVLADYFGVSLDFFAGRSDSPNHGEPPEPTADDVINLLGKDEAELLEAFGKLDVKGKNKVLGYAHGMAELAQGKPLKTTRPRKSKKNTTAESEKETDGKDSDNETNH